jgi:hypothetical protein
MRKLLDQESLFTDPHLSEAFGEIRKRDYLRRGNITVLNQKALLSADLPGGRDCAP